jgi:trans-aconitate methyltransferase
MSNDLTDKAFWANYWESKKGLAFTVPPNYTFHRLLKTLVAQRQIKSAIELGGFPGYYAIFLKKYLNVNATLFDFYVHQKVLQQVLDANSLDKETIGVIEGDLFAYQPQQQYDLVLSCGLIEHFEDTKDIIERHINFLKPGGTLFITLPNFTGVNGWVQQQFDAENYSKHNIKSMDIDLLKNICTALNLNNVEANYYGGFSIWLENRDKQPAAVKALMKTLWLAGKVFTKAVPVETRALSPYIVVKAIKPLN